MHRKENNGECGEACCLCLRVRHLVKSHIIPEFVYKTLYDKKHRFHVLSTDKNPPKSLEQKGLREKLLCEECELKISRYEKYASEVFLGGTEISIQSENSYIQITDVDYTKFKLFQLSILWRCGVAKDRIYDRVVLGRHEESIRTMIYSENPGRQLDYPCVIFALKSKEDIHANFIDQPRKLRIDGHIAYRFIFLGFMWIYYVSSHELPELPRRVAINEDGKMIMGYGNFEELHDIKDFMIDLYKIGRLKKPTT